MKRVGRHFFILTLVIGLALSFSAIASAQTHYTTIPQLPTLQSPPTSSWQPIIRDLMRQRHGKEMLLWESIRQSQREPTTIPTPGLGGIPAEQQRAWEWRAIQNERSRYAECAKYSRYCTKMLRSFGK